VVLVVVGEEGKLLILVPDGGSNTRAYESILSSNRWV
jgi:hypothetical protein